MNQPSLSPSAYTVAWVSALPIESAAAAEMLDEEHHDPRGHGTNTDQDVFGRIGNHNVVMVRMPSGRMGNSAAAAAIARITTSFPSILFALMIGIGGGVPSAVSDIKLGDVVVGHPHLQHSGVVQYDFGKTGPDGQMRTGALDAPPKVLLHAIAKLREDLFRGRSNFSKHLSAFDRLPRFSRSTTGPDALFQPTYRHAGGETCQDCDKGMIIERPGRASKEVVIHYGTIASGNQVMRDGIKRDKLSAELGAVLCFEMEAAGLASTFPCAVIRGICDYADSHKNKSWQPYAAATAAAVAKEILLLVPAVKAVRSETIIDSSNYRVLFSLNGVPVSRFADRPKDMERLEQVLLPQTGTGDCRRRVLILQGLGGIGKTQLAVEFTRKHQAAFTAVFWLDGSSEGSLKRSIADCASRIPEGQIAETSRRYSSANGDLDRVVHDVIDWLSRRENKHWMMVFDNVDRDYQQQKTDVDAYDINDYIPYVDHGSILITTRLASLQQLGEPLPLRSVGMSQARAIFRKWYNQDFDPSESNELLGLLDGLPLALAQAATYMSETGTSFGTYTRLYNQQWKDLMDNDMAPLRSYGNGSISTTWTVSYNAIRAKNEGAANLLLLWAHLNNRTLPYLILQAGSNKSSALAETLSEWFNGAADDELQFFNTIRLLRSYCLVESLQGSSTQNIHPVVHQWAFHVQDESQRAALSRLAILIIAYAIPDEYTNGYYQMQRQLSPHAESWVERIEGITADSEVEMDEEMPYALHRAGILLSNRGNLGIAEKMYRRALKGYEKAWGPDHTSTLDIVNNLGAIYKAQGKLADAEKMYRRALEGKEKAWGPDHISTLSTVNNLGAFYQAQGKLADAEKMYRRALEGYKKAWGPDHTATLSTVNNLGALYQAQGKLADAETMYRRALEGKEKALGPDHTSTLFIVNNLGLLYADQGKLADAEKMYRRALEGYKKAWGPDHTSTLSTINNLGVLYKAQGKLADAEKVYRRALEGKEKAWGPDHTSTLSTVNNLGLLYKAQGKLADAEKMYRRAVEGYEKALGPDNVFSYVPALNTAYSYGILFEDQGNLYDAKLMYTRALRGYEIVFGTDYRWYRAARDRLKNLESSGDSRSASPLAATRLDRQAVDVTPMTGSADPTKTTLAS